MPTRELIRATGTSSVLEQRTRALADTDAHLVRAEGDDGARRFVGHAAVFDSRTAIGNPLSWGFYEEVTRSAFDKTLSEGDARFLVDHDSRLLVARVSAGDLDLAADDVGLAVDAGLDTELSYVRDLARNLEKRRITGMSFGFYVVRDRWEVEQVDTSDGHSVDVYVRYLEELRLIEVSAVTFPAYEDTDAGLRAKVDEVRAARGVPTQTSPPASGRARPAPADATQDDQTPAPAAEATRGDVRHLDERLRVLVARDGLS